MVPKRLAVLALLAGLLVSGCGASPPDPNGLVWRAAAHLAQTPSVRFRLDVLGTPAYLDPVAGIALTGGAGEYEKPARVRASLRALYLAQPVLIGFVGLGDERQWTDPTTRRWVVPPANLTFDPTTIFDPADGLASALRDVTGWQHAGREVIGRADTYHLRASAPAGPFAPLVGGILQTDKLQVEVWVGAGDETVRQVRISEPGLPGAATPALVVHLADFGAPIVVEAPA